MRRLAVLLVLVLGLSGCGLWSAPPDTDSIIRGGTITLGYVGTAAPLDVHRAPGPHPAHNLVFDTLVVRGPGAEFLPHLGAEWQVRSDGLELGLRLRSGVSFHDGTPLTAEAVVANLERLRRTASPLLPGSVRTFLDCLVSATAAGPLDVELVFDRPFAQVFHVLTLPQLAPMSPAAWASGTGTDAVAGTGPYRLHSLDPTGTVVLDRNPHYLWPAPFYENEGPAHLARIVLKPFSDDIRMLADFRAGLIDVTLVPEFVSPDEPDQNARYQTAASSTVHYLAFNLQRELWQDVEARRAVAGAIHPRTLLESVRGPAAANASPLAPGVWGHQIGLAAGITHRYDPEAAARVFSALWYEAEEAALQLEPVAITTFLGGDFPQVAETIASQLRRVGLPATVQLVDSGQLWSVLAAREFDLALLSYSWDEPSFLSRYFAAAGEANRTGVVDEELDALLELLQVTVDPSGRLEVLTELQQLLVERAYWVWLYTPLTITGVSPRLDGVRLAPWGELWLHDARLAAVD